MLYGAVDIGSNTIKLMVGGKLPGGEIFRIHEKTLPVRLGAGTFETGFFSKQSIEIGIAAVSELVSQAKKQGASQIGIYATSAVRSAKNADDFVSAVSAATGIPVVVLSGDEEAEFIFRGVCSDPELRQRRIWVVDVGGGSVEFILGTRNHVERKTSLELGSVRITSMFCPQFPPVAGIAEKIVTFLTEKFQETLACWDLADALAVATGGSALCISRWGKIEGDATLSLSTLLSVIKELSRMDLEMLNSDSRIPKGRGEVLLAGAATYASALKCASKEQFKVSEKNLRYGLLDFLATSDNGKISDFSLPAR